jgi:hypothetical protein
MTRLLPHFSYDGDAYVEEHKSAEKSQEYEEEETEARPRRFSQKGSIEDKPLRTDIKRQKDQEKQTLEKNLFCIPRLIEAHVQVKIWSRGIKKRSGCMGDKVASSRQTRVQCAPTQHQ